MSLPLPGDERANGSASTLEPVKITTVQNPLREDASDVPDGGITAWGTALGAYVFWLAITAIYYQPPSRFLIQFCGFG
jgi:hypothetical protein